MSKEYKRSKNILTLGIISILLEVLSIVLIVWYFILTTSKLIGSEYIDGVVVWGDTVESIIMLSVGIISLVVCVILSFIASILILCSQFNNKSLDDIKIIMGILSILLFGSITVIIFGSMAVNKLKNQTQSTQIDDVIGPVV